VAELSPSTADIVRDAHWLADRYDPEHDAVHFRHITREQHRAATFLTDEYLGKANNSVIIGRLNALTVQPTQAPIHFIFHSAFCCSTLLARALDVPGVSMGLKEPVILNDIVGWRMRGGDSRQVGYGLDSALTLLARPFGSGETVLIKPSNVCNGLAETMMALRPNANALLLYAPLRIFLGSIAKKEMWGRLWVRDLMIKQLKEGFIDLGLHDEDYLGLTDLQAAGIGWLAQHALFRRMINRFGTTRVLILDSESLLATPLQAIRKLSSLFHLKLSDEVIRNIISGPIFTRHSKFNNDFDANTRKSEQRDALAVYGEEIDMVAKWIEVIAINNAIPLNTSP
jgi:hypothetical protein